MIDQIIRSISDVCFDHPSKKKRKKEKNKEEKKKIELAPTCGKVS